MPARLDSLDSHAPVSNYSLRLPLQQNGVAGNCGAVSQESDKVIALPTSTYAGGSHCGAMIKITRVDNGATVVARVADSCPTCVNSVSLDLSVGAFTAIATESEGMVPITWQWA